MLIFIGMENTANIEEGINDLRKYGHPDEIAKKVAEKLRLGNPTEIGKGTQGIAYGVDKDRVMKLTTDMSEVVEASKIKGKNFAHLPEIFGVYALKGNMAGLYVIVNELLSQPFLFFTQIESLRKGWLDIGLKDELGLTFFDFIKDYLTGSSSSKNLKIAATKIKNELPEFYDIFNQYITVLNDIKAAGIKSADVHPINMGFKNNGNLAYFDLGYGDNKMVHEPESVEIDELRSIIREEIENIVFKDEPR